MSPALGGLACLRLSHELRDESGCVGTRFDTSVRDTSQTAIAEARRKRPAWRDQGTAVEKEIASGNPSKGSEVELRELRPLRRDGDRVRPLARIDDRRTHHDVRVVRKPSDGGVESADDQTMAYEPAGARDCRRRANVGSARLEREPQHPDPAAPGQRLLDGPGESGQLSRVLLDGGAEDDEVVSRAVGDRLQRCGVLRKARATPAESGTQVLRADSWVQGHRSEDR